MTVFLTPDEIVELTGLRRPSAQMRWLDRNGIRAFRRADGGVSVPRAAVEQGRQPKGPNWEALARPR